MGVASRSEAHERGLWHQVFHCQIVAQRPAASERAVMVLQRRAQAKAAFAGLLDVSAAGHLAAGEAPADGARELAEELGVIVEPSALVPLGVRRLADDSGEGKVNKEHTHVFLLRDDRPLVDYVLAPDEVDAVFDVPIDGLLSLLAADVATLRVAGVRAAGTTAARAVTETITLADLVPSFGYWTTLAVMAQRFVNGERPLAI